MRIFFALDIPTEIRKHLAEYMERIHSYAPEARWARVEGLHVTLKFVGEVNEELVRQMKSALAELKAAPVEVKFAGVGFFPNAKAARVFWAGVDGGSALPKLASEIDSRLSQLGIAKEEKPYKPHLTLARATTHPLRELAPLLPQPAQERRELGTPVAGGAMPHFGTMTAREFFMYQSQPQRGGSKYTKLERFELA